MEGVGEIIRCPSGLEGEIRGLTGQEARLLSDRAAIRSGVFMDRILSACWLNTTEPGPYEIGTNGKPDWSKVLVGDRFFILLKIRCRSFGSGFDFKIQCNNQGCRQRFSTAIDLNELPVKELSDEDRVAFAEGNRLEGMLGDRHFWFKLPTGADEVKYMRESANITSFIGPMVARIHEIEGLEEMEKRKFFEQGELALAFEALSEMEAHDCGIETATSVECDRCGNVMDIEIPFAQGFLAPIGAKRTQTS